MMKCTRCKTEMMIDEFNVNGKINKNCKKCVDECKKAHNERNKKYKAKLKQRPPVGSDEKFCTSCQTVLKLDEFKDKNGKQRLTCNGCNSERDREIGEDEKFCKRCKRVLKLDQFKQDTGKRKITKCKECNQKTLDKMKEKLEEKVIGENEKVCPCCKKTLDLNEFADRVGGKKCVKCKDCNKKQLEYLKENKCPHGKMNKSACKECGGTSICQHNRSRTYCPDCNGGSLCEHKIRKDRCEICEDKYGRHQYCEHNKLKTICKDCEGGSFCEHNTRRTRCKHCGGGSVCEHNKQRDKCEICDYVGYFGNKFRSKFSDMVKSFVEGKTKVRETVEYLGCDLESYKRYLESKFVEGMNWNNYRKDWQIDHIIPLKYNKPTIEDVKERLDYKNTQPLWTRLNIRKGNRYIGSEVVTGGCPTEVGKTVIPPSLNAPTLMFIDEEDGLGDTPQ
jgi:hypothetical protein